MDLIDELRVRDSQQLRQLIEMHLSFIVHINHFHFDSLDTNNANLNSTQTSVKKKFNFNINDNHNNAINKEMNSIFGAPLTHQGICAIYQLIEFISKDQNVIIEGIFRKSGSSSRQLELRNLISQGITIHFESNRFTVHDACSVLKIFLSELPQPLLTESHFEIHCKIADLCEDSNKEKRLKALQLLLLLLPATNRKLLQDLLTMFQKIINNTDSNKMSSHSLAILFAPTIILPKHVDMKTYLNTITNALLFMIDNIPYIFNAPNELIIDIKKQIKKQHNSSGEDSVDEAVCTSYTFCIPQHNPLIDSADYTAKQLAQLYAYVQSIPQSRTPQKKKWIKKFNLENGSGTPLLKKENSESGKKIKSIGGVLKAGQKFLFGSSLESSKIDSEKDCNLTSNSPLRKSQFKKQLYKSQEIADNLDVASNGKFVSYLNDNNENSVTGTNFCKIESNDITGTLNLSTDSSNKRLKT